MAYRTGRWFRRLINPPFEDIDPAKLNWVLAQSRGDGVIVAPVLNRWFIYQPEERKRPVTTINHTCSDIRWFIGRLMAPFGTDPVLPQVTTDLLVVWTNRAELATGDLVPATGGEEHEWMVYMSWVQHVLTRNATARKGGRLRRTYPRWFRTNFPEEDDPIYAAQPHPVYGQRSTR